MKTKKPDGKKEGKALPKLDTAEAVVAFVAENGVVLFSARGAGPTLVDAIAGEKVKGSWWGHPAGHQIFALAEALESTADILWCKLLDGKRTLVHRRLWPALVRLEHELGAERLASVRQEHTPSGAHRKVVEPFSQWLEPAVKREGERLSREEAIALLPPGIGDALGLRAT